MIIKYVWKNFTRRKVRTVLMLMALVVSISLVVAMSATVETMRQSSIDLIATATGRYDIALRKTDLADDPFIPISIIDELASLDPKIINILPRFEATVEMNAYGTLGNVTLVGIDPTADNIGFVDVITGSYTLGQNQIALFETTALSYGLGVGDTIEAAYTVPIPREEGVATNSGISQRQAVATFTISSLINQSGVVSAAIYDGFFVDIADVQKWLELEGEANQLILVLDPSVYTGDDAEESALQVRTITQKIHQFLGDSYSYAVDKAIILEGAAQAFMAAQAVINLYGFTSLGVVGLLMHTLVTVNYQEQRRELAILRILGAQRWELFIFFMSEVLILGFIGVLLGIVGGRLITQYIIVPIIMQEMAKEGLNVMIQPIVNWVSILPVVFSATAVLFGSTLQPAREAANTKVMHAINPGVADNIQIEDLTKLRERAPSIRLFFIGLIMMLAFFLILGFQIVFELGNPALMAGMIFFSLILMLLGTGFLFFITTVPFERLLLFLMGLIAPRLAYFSKRNVGRGQTRNTLISLLVLFSGILPSFLATNSALEIANQDNQIRSDMGAEITVHPRAKARRENNNSEYLDIPFMEDKLMRIEGVDQLVGVSYSYNSRIKDTVGMRNSSVQIMGINGRLDQVLFSELISFVPDPNNPENPLATFTNRPHSLIIGKGLADFLAVSLYDEVKIVGAGLDHEQYFTVVGIAEKIPGFSGFGTSREQASWQSDILVSMDSFYELITPLDQDLPNPNDPIYNKILIGVNPDDDPLLIREQINKDFTNSDKIRTESYRERLQFSRDNQRISQIFLLVLTSISFVTAVFGVFAVIYVTIYARRTEIGMMKAIGIRRWEMTGSLVIEAIAMTLSAALAGITAGTVMSYLTNVTNYFVQQQKLIWAFDGVVTPFIVIMVVLASIIGTIFSARRIVKHKAIDILRM